MKSFLFTIALFVFCLISLQSQNQIENPGFEDWEDVDLPVEEPTEWSSIKTGDVPILNTAAPIVWGRSEDAHSGNYSLKLFNVYVQLIGQSAVGMMTNGRVHPDLNLDNSWSYTDTLNSQWNTELTVRPDSLAGWFKCYPETGDFGTVKAVVHKGYGQQPEGDYEWIGVAYYELPGDTVNEWTRFSVPFEYFSNETPEYLLCYLTSGNGVDAVGESSALFDDLLLVFNNPGFEDKVANQFRIYSDQNNIFISLKDKTNSKYQINVIDLTGRICYSDEFTGSEMKKISLNLQDGIYIVNAVSNGKTFSKKVVINS